MWRYYNPNPDANNVGDCVIRAICKAIGLEWDDAFARVSAEAYIMKDMPSSNAVWGAFLRHRGFTWELVDDHSAERYTVRMF